MSVKLRNRHRLKNKEIRDILNELKTKFDSDFFDVDSSVEIGNLDQFKVILVDEEIVFMIIEDKVVFIKSLSEEAVGKVPENVDFVYIDGNHRYEYVKKDIELYWPKIKIGGVLAGHDFKSGEDGVRKAVKEYFGGRYTHIERSWDWFCIK